MLEKVEKSIFLTKPIIGVVSRSVDDYYKINKSIFNMINRFDAIPMMILPIDEKDLDDLLKLCNGIILPGGSDINNYDKYICKYCIENDIPILGICLGMQVMGCLNENNLEENKINHQNVTHLIKTKKNTIVGNIVGDSYVNSRHNFHITKPGIYKVSAYSDYIEAIEYDKNRFNVGVQWHPEDMIDYDEKQRNLIKKFIEETKNTP